MFAQTEMTVFYKNTLNDKAAEDGALLLLTVVLMSLFGREVMGANLSRHVFKQFQDGKVLHPPLKVGGL